MLTDIKIDTTEELRSVLDEITLVNSVLDFKWHFDFESNYSSLQPGWFVRVGFERPDTNTGVPALGWSRREFIAQGTTESGVVKTCWLLIELTIRHELMEGFRWQGKRIFNPHNSIHALASLQGK